ncbi:Uma2 family endonuclease [Streptomyces sp. NPDC056600]|uniref:Uma2 family endonuclease n=1 Tax=Streptomyces sp. NPDC056600 TaxID=3345874 RepID=UPI003686D417
MLNQEEFEELARMADRVNEAVRLEFIEGRVLEKPMPDGDHDTIVEWLTRVCIQSRSDWWLYPDRGLRIDGYRQGNARPDGSLAVTGTFAGQGEWASPDGVLMVVEVTSHDRDTHARDHVEKPRAYAGAGIPVFLLVDRDSCEVKVHSEPEGGRYTRQVVVPYGKTVTLPDPVGIELDTEPLKDWTR